MLTTITQSSLAELKDGLDHLAPILNSWLVTVLLDNRFGLIVAMMIIQFVMPHGTRRITRESILAWVLGTAQISIDPKYLREYRCPNCNKLLAKGNLKHKEDVLEVKCRGCSGVYLFKGEDADIIEKRSVYLQEGLIPDPDSTT